MLITLSYNHAGFLFFLPFCDWLTIVFQAARYPVVSALCLECYSLRLSCQSSLTSLTGFSSRRRRAQQAQRRTNVITSVYAPIQHSTRLMNRWLRKKRDDLPLVKGKKLSEEKENRRRKKYKVISNDRDECIERCTVYFQIRPS